MKTPAVDAEAQSPAGRLDPSSAIEDTGRQLAQALAGNMLGCSTCDVVRQVRKFVFIGHRFWRSRVAI